jgi:hypothetical protein
VFSVGTSPAGLIEADALPASDNAPATPNAVTALLRPLLFDAFFERDIVATSLWLISPEPRPKNSLALPCAPYKHYLCFNSSGSLAMFAAMRRASSLVSGLAAARRPGSSSK